MIEFRRLYRHFGSTRAVHDITFEVRRGQVFGYIGPNGAGKTTSMRILATLDLPTWGDAFVDGFSCINDPDRVRRRLGRLGRSGRLMLCGRLRQFERLDPPSLLGRLALLGRPALRQLLAALLLLPVGRLAGAGGIRRLLLRVARDERPVGGPGLWLPCRG